MGKWWITHNDQQFKRHQMASAQSAYKIFQTVVRIDIGLMDYICRL